MERDDTVSESPREEWRTSSSTHVHVLSLNVNDNKSDFATERAHGYTVSPGGKEQAISLILCYHVVIVIQSDTTWKELQTLGASEADSFLLTPLLQTLCVVLLENICIV